MCWQQGGRAEGLGSLGWGTLETRRRASRVSAVSFILFIISTGLWLFPPDPPLYDGFRGFFPPGAPTALYVAGGRRWKRGFALRGRENFSLERRALAGDSSLIVGNGRTHRNLGIGLAVFQDVRDE